LKAPLFFCAALAAALAAGTARADGPVLTGWYAPSGVALGASLHEAPRSNGLVLGVEQSLVYQRGRRAGFWGGLWGEALYDFGPGRGRLSLGPELGYGVVGIDGGFLAVLRGPRADAGVQGRLLLTMGVAAAYGRVGSVLGDEHYRFGEVGILLKWPWWLGSPPSPRAP